MAKWLALLIILFPLSIHQLDYRSRFSHGISLHMKRTSPAYAALEDMTESYNDRTPPAQYREVVRLAARKVRIVTAMNGVQEQRLALHTMVIRQSFKERPSLQPNMDLRIETAAGLLPLEERKRILVQYFRKENWSSPSVQQRAKQLVDEEMKSESAVNPDTRVIASAVSSSPIIVTKPGTDVSGLVSGSHPRQRSILLAANDVSPSAAPSLSTENAWHGSPMTRALMPRMNEASNLTVTRLPAEAADPHQLKGELVIKEGLAFMGAETFFTLRRVDEGRALETGRIMVSDARFEIGVKEMRGRLVAELHARSGELLGRGNIDLDGLDLSEPDPLRIELTPVATGASVKVASGYSEGTHQIPVKNALVAFDPPAPPQGLNADGLRVDSERTPRSTYIVQAQAKGHWPSLAMGVEGSQQEIRLYPQTLVKSLLDLALKDDQRRGGELGAVVWGRVFKDGKPISGVEVELAGDYNPVYFNSLYLPDRSQSSTFDNGLFAFLLVRPGVQAVRVKYKGKSYPAQIFPTESRHLSYVEIRLEANRSVNVALEDHFDPRKHISAHVRFVGVEDEARVDGEQKLHYPAGPQVMMLEADAGSEYELSRVQVLKDDARVTVPLIRRDWLQTIIDIKQINLIPERGRVVGFVADRPFHVDLAGYAGEIPQFVYFDAQGQIVEGDSGPAGGGFVLFNAPLGLQTLLVKPLSSNQVFSEVFVAEPEFVHSFKYSFGEAY